jgi:hypothetical protein
MISMTVSAVTQAPLRGALSHVRERRAQIRDIRSNGISGQKTDNQTKENRTDGKNDLLFWQVRAAIYGSSYGSR